MAVHSNESLLKFPILYKNIVYSEYFNVGPAVRSPRVSFLSASRTTADVICVHQQQGDWRCWQGEKWGVSNGYDKCCLEHLSDVCLSVGHFGSLTATCLKKLKEEEGGPAMASPSRLQRARLAD